MYSRDYIESLEQLALDCAEIMHECGWQCYFRICSDGVALMSLREDWDGTMEVLIVESELEDVRVAFAELFDQADLAG